MCRLSRQRRLWSTFPETALGVWEISDREAFRIDVTPGRGGIHHFVAADGEDIWRTLRRLASAWFEPGRECPFHRLELAAGTFYPRMARPTDVNIGDSPGHYPGEVMDKNVVAKARSQLAALTSMLDQICQTVHPEGTNLDVFGHAIRDLLILASTEVEAHWRGVLAANGHLPARPTTMDYVKLAEPMRLGEYAISMPCFPWLDPFAPFNGWTVTGSPTKDLTWYRAYNETKHDRDLAFPRASLRNAFHALCACVVMAIAQFGSEAALGVGTLLSTNFVLEKRPRWRPEQIYSNPYSRPDWIAVPFSF
jgi:hypothetical protein